ncbi:MAG: SpoIIE family protein phosphatase [Victivallales bacterium]|jgi:sigma-B regulation protein RsbU (phosphoserine phosphatase)
MIKFLNHSLVHRMTALILLGAGLVMLLVLGFSYFIQRNRILASAMRQSDTLTQSAVFQIEIPLGRAEAVVQQTALLLADKKILREESTEIIRNTLERNPNIFGMAITLSEKQIPHSDFNTLYGWRETANAIQVLGRDSAAQDYQQDWFYLPFHLQRPVWTEPYYDTDAKTLMVTYSFPVLRSGEVIAVVTCDLSLKWLHKLLDTLPLGKGGMAILYSQRGTYISNPIRAYEMTETVFSVAEAQTDPEMSSSLHQLGLDIMSGQPGFRTFKHPIDNQTAFIHYRPVPATGWVLGLIQPRKQVLTPLVRLNEISALVGLAGLALLLIPALGIAWSVTRPLQRLAVAANQLAAGNFDAPLPAVNSKDEVARLTGAFEQMRRDLRKYIADLTATTAAKERISGELSAAREIQMSIVPKLFPPFPNRPEIDLYAILIPAREVGGDLYDFMLLDEDHLYLAIGDVSGKGVPASLLMAVGKTLLKSTMQTVRDPARAMTQVNSELSEDNESCMFITMFCGILNIKTGSLIYANAGHNPPFLTRKEGAIRRLDNPPGPALAVVPGAIYQDHSIQLDDKDLLILYTDGVTEAMNPSNIMFDEEGLLEHIRSEGHQSAKLFLQNLGRKVHEHAAGAEQSDDITALAVRYRAAPAETESQRQSGLTHGRRSDASLSLRNRLEELGSVPTWIDEQIRALALPPSLAMDLNLVLEEWIVNVISYSYADKSEHTIAVRLWRDNDELRLEIEDDGRPFDPTAQADVDTAMPLEHRKIGGLGIHFIRKTMDRFTYRRENDRNIVTLVKTVNRKLL